MFAVFSDCIRKWDLFSSPVAGQLPSVGGFHQQGREVASAAQVGLCNVSNFSHLQYKSRPPSSSWALCVWGSHVSPDRQGSCGLRELVYQPSLRLIFHQSDRSSCQLGMLLTRTLNITGHKKRCRLCVFETGVSHPSVHHHRTESTVETRPGFFSCLFFQYYRLMPVSIYLHTTKQAVSTRCTLTS